MEFKRCIPCGGSGRLMSGGMMQKDCEHCHGSGKIAQPEDEINYLQMKTTDSYISAIEKIQAADEKITKKEAEELFKKEFERIDSDKLVISMAKEIDSLITEPKKRGRPKK